MRKKSRGLLLATLMIMAVTLVTSLGAVPKAQAALNPPASAVSAIEAHGFPLWYADKNGLTLQLCLDQNLKCVMTPAVNNPPAQVTPNFDPFFGPATPITGLAAPGVPLINDQNFPLEVFYWMADTGASKVGLPLAVGAPAGAAAPKFRLVMSLSAGFTTLLPYPGAPQDGNQTTMLRINLFKILGGLVPNSTYTIATPYGSFPVTTDAIGAVTGGVGGQGFRTLLGGAAALNFTSVMPALLPGIGVNPAIVPAQSPLMDNFLVCQAGAPAGYIGDPLVACTVGFASNPAVQQFVSVTGPGLPTNNPVTGVITTPAALGVNGTFTFSGMGITGKKFGMDIAPSALDLGKVAMATPPAVTKASAVRTLTITNVNSVSNMILTSVTLGGPNAADFTIDPATTTCAANTSLLAAANPPVAGSSCTIGVTFKPNPLGPAAPEVALRKATITIPATFPLPVGAVPPPDGVIPLTGTAQLTMAATAGANGTISPQGTALFVDAGVVQSFTIQPNAKFMVKDITVNGALAHFVPPAKFSDPVTFAAPAANINGQTVNVTFMPSGDLDGNGTLDSGDALKALRILVGLQAPAVDDPAAMKVFPLDSTGRPNPAAGAAADLNDVVLILKRALNIITW